MVLDRTAVGASVTRRGALETALSVFYEVSAYRDFVWTLILKDDSVWLDTLVGRVDASTQCVVFDDKPDCCLKIGDISKVRISYVFHHALSCGDRTWHDIWGRPALFWLDTRRVRCVGYLGKPMVSVLADILQIKWTCVPRVLNVPLCCVHSFELDSNNFSYSQAYLSLYCSFFSSVHMVL